MVEVAANNRHATANYMANFISPSTMLLLNNPRRTAVALANDEENGCDDLQNVGERRRRVRGTLGLSPK